MPDKIPFVLKITGTRGAIGKCYVIKYRRSCGYYMCRYPNMKNISPSEKQRKHRNLFREAMDYAKWVKSDPQRKKAFLNTMPVNKRRWMPHRWMVKYYIKASPALREKLKAKMRKSKERLKVAIVNPLKNCFYNQQWQPLWQKSVNSTTSPVHTPHQHKKVEEYPGQNGEHHNQPNSS